MKQPILKMNCSERYFKKGIIVFKVDILFPKDVMSSLVDLIFEKVSHQGGFICCLIHCYEVFIG